MNRMHDYWEPLHSYQKYGAHRLTSVEFTVTNLCNMRCEHCAVGEELVYREGSRIPLPLILRRLDEAEHLQTISITGGEPMFSEAAVKEYILPLLQYARDRGLRSQLNSNATMELERYEWIAPYLDILHISFNYVDARDYHEIGFARFGREIGFKQAQKLYERMLENTRALSKNGLHVSAESMVNYRTHKKLEQIHRIIAEIGCFRHEVHPMYASDFAAALPVLSLDEIRSALHRLLDRRNPDIWILFGTLPFFACSEREEDRLLVERIRQTPNTTVRNDPDGRNRLNVNLFTGEIRITDFSETAPVGSIFHDRLDDVFARWLGHPLQQKVNCHCPQADCLGPNLLVADMYYPGVDFKQREAMMRNLTGSGQVEVKR